MIREAKVAQELPVAHQVVQVVLQVVHFVQGCKVAFVARFARLHFFLMMRWTCWCVRHSRHSLGPGAVGGFAPWWEREEVKESFFPPLFHGGHRGASSPGLMLRQCLGLPS